MPDTHLPTFAPNVTAETEPFWKATEEEKLVLPRCTACDFVIWYPRALCPQCGSFDIEWFEASGRGTIYTYTIVHKGNGPWAQYVPYAAAYVELDEGPRIMTNIVGVDPSTLEVGMPVEVVWEATSDDGSGPRYYRFTPVAG